MIHKFLKNIGWFACLLLILGCDTVSEPADSNKINAFFDLSGYFNQEINRLKSINAVRKIAQIREGREEISLSGAEINFNTELSSFIRSDINKQSWLHKYEPDTVLENGIIKTLTYKALDPDLKTRKLDISFQDNKVSAIQILNQTKSIVATTVQKLEYVPSKGYVIDDTQKIMFSEERHIRIEVLF